MSIFFLSPNFLSVFAVLRQKASESAVQQSSGEINRFFIVRLCEM